jgi:formylglycine-generating enzyme required for sulfatase activity
MEELMKNTIIIVLLLIALVFIVSCEKKKTTEPDVEKVAIPTFTPAGGPYDTTQTVTISCATAGAVIRYTTNHMDPTETSTIYTVPIQVAWSKTVKAIAYKTGWTPSDISPSNYYINIIPEAAQMVSVTGGTFSAYANYTVTVSNFNIANHEVTQGEYETIMGNNPAEGNAYLIGQYFPIYWVKWYNAIEYCNKRSINEGLTPCYSYTTLGTNPVNWPTGWSENDNTSTNITCDWNASGYRLPTEAEWLFASRGGLLSQNYIYSGGNDIDSLAWYQDNSDGDLHIVATKAANELGLRDMSGNVAEWVWDLWNATPTGTVSDPTGPTTGVNRTYIGGHYASSPEFCAINNSISRSWEQVTSQSTGIGFRVCRRTSK